MGVKMMRWRPWPPLITRKYEVRLVVKRLEGLPPGNKDGDERRNKLAVEIKWKGPKMALSSLRRAAIKRNYTREVEEVDPDGVVEWEEEFQSLCAFSAYKENVFLPWEIAFTAFNVSLGLISHGSKNRTLAIGTANLNLSEYVYAAEQKEVELGMPLNHSGGASATCPLLRISLSFCELRTAQETSELVQRSIVPVPSPPQSGVNLFSEKDELSAIKAGLRKVKIFTDFVSTRKAKKTCLEEEGSESRCSTRSEDAEYNYPFDSDSHEDFEGGETDEGKNDSNVRKSFSYGTLAYANYVGTSLYSNMGINGEDEGWVYYSNRKSDVGSSHVEDFAASISESSTVQNSKRGLLSWRKRKLSFRSPKARGEPLLKKAYGEEGGDDIDYDRRLLSSDESPFGWQKMEEDSLANRSSISEFGDDNFAVGSWEQKEVLSRDGQLKLQTEVFFSSIDQRSERAAGESACTALVAVIADWFHNNSGLMPIKSQFDSLIREGSLEWRNLCENETYKERFPDKHFDLDTVLQAQIRPLSVLPGKSCIGFFHPDGMDEGRFDFLRDAMSFDEIWEEISHGGAEFSCNCKPQVYIVSWNDHFFILEVESEAYYIIDTLGERLYEGCNQAFILKFDSKTAICRTPPLPQLSDEKADDDQQIVAAAGETGDRQTQQTISTAKEDCCVLSSGETRSDSDNTMTEAAEVICRGKECCKEYIKSFLAAIPIRELQADIKKGLIAATPLHHRLQIELHYTLLLQPPCQLSRPLWLAKETESTTETNNLTLLEVPATLVTSERNV